MIGEAGDSGSRVTVAHAAVQYVGSGLVLVAVAAGTKGPTSIGWNRREHCVTTAEAARSLRASVGLAHAYSGTCALDIDDLVGARAWFAERGLDLDTWLRAPERVGIRSGRANRAKLLFRLPVPLVSIKVNGVDGRTIFEFRCATRDGLTVQDVLPPSVHPDGTAYAWDTDELVGDWRTIPQLPDELRALWVVPAERPAPASPIEAYVPPTGVSIAQARELVGFIDARPYDEWLRVGMALHHEYGDEGLDLWDTWSQGADNYGGRADLERRWEGFGRRTGASITLRYVIKRAREAGAPVAAVAQVPALAPGRFAFEPAASFAAKPAPEWIVKRLLPSAGFGVVFGESGSGKSFWVLDLVCAVARGAAWRGEVARQCRVAYVVAEGAGGFRLRLKAYSIDQGVDLADVPLVLTADAPNLLELEHTSALIESLKAAGELGLVVIDTLAATTPGANENSGEDMGRFLAHCKAIHEATGALVVAVHHAGKDSSKGARGWSGVRAAADVEIEITRQGDDREAKVTKQKDGADAGRYPFKLKTIELGPDADGELVTSCTVDQVDAAQARPKKRKQPSRNQAIVLAAAIEVADLSGSAAVSDVVAEAVRRMASKVDDKGQDRRKEAAQAALESLGSAGEWLKIYDDVVTILANGEK